MNPLEWWLHTIHRDPPRPGHLIVTTWIDGRPTTDAFSPDVPLDRVARLIEARDQRGDVYVRTSLTSQAPPRGKRGKKELTAGLIALPLDLDAAHGTHAAPKSGELWPDLDTIRAFTAHLGRLGVPVTALVDTGGGAHGLVAVHGLETCGAEMAEAVLRRWTLFVNATAAEFGPWPADNVANSDRILRPPGTRSKKYDPPRPVELIATGSMIDAAELLSLLPVEPETEPTPRPKPSPLAIGAASDDSDLDRALAVAFADTTFGDIITRHGWTHRRATGDGDEWWRPEKSSGTCSAVSHDGADPFLWVFSTSEGVTRLPPKYGHSKLQVLAHLDHGGDINAAIDAVLPGWRDARRAERQAAWIARTADWLASLPTQHRVARALHTTVRRLDDGPGRDRHLLALIAAAVAGGLPPTTAALIADRALHPAEAA